LGRGLYKIIEMPNKNILLWQRENIKEQKNRKRVKGIKIENWKKDTKEGENYR